MIMSATDRTNLYLVGVNHADLEGEERLLRILREIAPDIVTVEGLDDSAPRIPQKITNLNTRDVIRYAQGEGRSRKEAADIARLTRSWFGTQNFEYRAVERYGEERGFRPHYIEDREASDQVPSPDVIKMIQDLVVTGTRNTHKADVQTHYKICREAYDLGVFPACVDDSDGPENGNMDRRNKTMAERLRRIAEAYPGKTVVHVGGDYHYFDSTRGTTMYDLLKGLAPTRVLLSEAPNYDEMARAEKAAAPHRF